MLPAPRPEAGTVEITYIHATSPCGPSFHLVWSPFAASLEVLLGKEDLPKSATIPLGNWLRSGIFDLDPDDIRSAAGQNRLPGAVLPLNGSSCIGCTSMFSTMHFRVAFLPKATAIAAFSAVEYPVVGSVAD